MKRFATETNFVPLIYVIGEGMKNIKDGKGNQIMFKTRKAVENYCIKNRCIYLESKNIFYR